MKPATIAPLTSLRFIFALFVFFSHLGFLSESKNSVLSWLFDHVFYEGYIGVSFFFMLSGFVLALNYRQRIVERQISFKQFMIARVARIFPMHIITLLVAVPLTFSAEFPINQLWFEKLALNLALIQSFIPFADLYFTFNSVSWSLSDELFFYLMFPLLILLINKLSSKLTLIMLSVIILTNILLFFLLSENFQHALLYINPIVRIVDFVIGIALFELYCLLKARNIQWNFGVLEWLSIAIFLLFFSVHEYVPESLRYAIFYWPSMCMILLVFSFQKGAVSKFLSNKIAIYLGEISFSFYLIHWLAIRYFDIFYLRFFENEKGVLFVMTVFLFSILVSAICFRYIEKPASKWIKRRFS